MYQILQKFDIHWHDGGPSITMMYHLRWVSDLLSNWKSCLLCYMKDVVLHCSIFFKWNKLVRVRGRVQARIVMAHAKLRNDRCDPRQQCRLGQCWPNVGTIGPTLGQRTLLSEMLPYWGQPISYDRSIILTDHRISWHMNYITHQT